MKKYYGKEKCRILKQIRAEIARQNDIEWVVSECKHQGDCRGTCPKCEQEVRQLEAALARREALGRKVAVVGISAGIALSVSGCENPFAQRDGEMLMGDPVLPPESEEMTETWEPLEGEEVPLPGEVPDETAETDFDEPLGGEPLPPEDDLGNIGEWDKVEP